MSDVHVVYRTRGSGGICTKHVHHQIVKTRRQLLPVPQC